MSADPALLLRASDLPGVLDGWCGPVVVETHGDVVDGAYVDGRILFIADGYECSLVDLDGTVLLDLSRAECRDRVARVVAARVGLECGSTAPRWYDEHIFRNERQWALVGAVPAFPVRFSSAPAWSARVVNVLSALDPADDRRLPDGSRWVDAAALVAVACHVGAEVPRG